MMQKSSSMLHNTAVRRFLLSYGVAVLLVIGYFIIRPFFQEEKVVEYKSFNTGKDSVDLTEKREEPIPEKEQKFILLPR